MTRSSLELKLHDKGTDTTQPPSSSLACSPSPSFIERRKNSNSIHETPEQEISGCRESLLKVGLSLLKYSVFIDAGAEPSQIQNLHICRDGSNPEFFGMPDQSDSIQSFLTISSITKSRFESLITKLSLSVSIEGPQS